MTTRFPADLPDVPVDRWGARMEKVISVEDDDGTIHAHINWTLDADDREQAERRALAVQYHDFEDELRGARAEATQAGGEWFVTIILAPYR